MNVVKLISVVVGIAKHVPCLIELIKLIKNKEITKQKLVEKLEHLTDEVRKG